MYRLMFLLLVALPAFAQTNPDRAYPPSCLQFPLATTPTGPTQSLDFTARTTPTGATEPVRATFWRVACANGNSAFLVTIRRLAPVDAAIELPQTFVSAGASGQLGTRLATEPNTFDSSSTEQAATTRTYVLEFASNASTTFDLDGVFTLSAVSNGNTVFNATVTAYDASQYPDASLALAIGGRLSGSWYDPAHPGEGIFLEVGEQGERFVFLSWFTYAPDGRAYWIIGQAAVPADARTVTVPMQYYVNGGFAGNFANATGQQWGTVTLAFPACDTLMLGFQSNALLPTDVPSGSGTRTWRRLVTIDGYACE